MAKRILKINKPRIWSYSFYGALFSILPQCDQILPWVYNNFIQLKYEEPYQVLYFDKTYEIFQNNEAFSDYTVSRDTVINHYNKDLIAFIKEQIEDKVYVWTFLDRFYYLEQRRAEGFHQSHEALFYGYDDDEKVFYCADNTLDGQYKTFTLSYEDACTSYWKLDRKEWKQKEISYFKDFHLIANVHIPETEIPVDIEQIRKRLSEYLISGRTIDYRNLTGFKFGLDAVGEHIRSVQQIIQSESNQNIDIRASHLLWEHKMLMLERVIYLQERGFLTGYQDFIEEYKLIVKEYRAIRNLSVKYNINHDPNLVKRYYERSQQMLGADVLMLTKLKNDLMNVSV